MRKGWNQRINYEFGKALHAHHHNLQAGQEPFKPLPYVNIVIDEDSSNGDFSLVDFLNALTANDRIALFALIVSLIVGVANWRHTNRAFRAATVPVLSIEPSQPYQNYIPIQVTNHSGEIAVRDLRVTSHITRCYDLIPRFACRWKRLDATRLRELAPLTSDQVAIPQEESQGLVAFLRKKFYSHLDPGNIVEMQQDELLRLRIHISYLPAVHGARRAQTQQFFKLCPRVASHSPNDLYYIAVPDERGSDCSQSRW